MTCKLQAGYDRMRGGGYDLDTYIEDIYPFVTSRVYAMLHQYLPAQASDLTDDVVQVVIWEIWQQINGNNQPHIRNIEAWIVTLIKFRCFDEIRRRIRSDEEQPDPRHTEVAPDDCGREFVLPNTLTKREQVIAARLSDGDSVVDISKALKLNRNTVRYSINCLKNKIAA